MSDLEIRLYTSEDEQEVIKLWDACGLNTPWNEPKEMINSKIAFQPDLFFVGLLDGKIISTIMVGYEGRRGWINDLGVHPDYQRKGYARKLMEKAEQVLKGMGCLKVNLQVREWNKGAIAFYESIGFTNDNVISYGKRLK